MLRALNLLVVPADKKAEDDVTEEKVVTELAQLRKLQAVADAALSGRELDQLLAELLPRLCEVFDADTCAVLLVEGDALVPRAAVGLEGEVDSNLRIPLGAGFVGRVARERRTIAVDDVASAEIVNPILKARGVTVLLGTPLMVGEQVLGVMHVGRRAQEPFRAEDSQLLELAAERVARALERALVYDKLVQLDKLKRQFIAVASHELRTPATSVHGLAATLHHRRGQLDPESQELLIRTLYEQSERLAHLTEQLLDLSRLDADVIQINPQPLRVRDQLEQIVATAGSGCEDKIELDVPEDLEAVLDADALEHVVGNLLVNALRYGEPPITISAALRDRHFRLNVEDHGAGIDARYVPQLFERFSHTSSGVAEHGAGLGLSIARDYARAHGGELLYHPEQHGARFELVLPRTLPAR